MIEIGVPHLDSDHRFLLAMLDELASAAQAGATCGLLEDQSLEVAASLESHFAKEERMLDEAQDANRPGHVAAHAILLDRLARMTGAWLADQGPEKANAAIRHFIQDLMAEIEAFDLPAGPGILAIQK